MPKPRLNSKKQNVVYNLYLFMSFLLKHGHTTSKSNERSAKARATTATTTTRRTVHESLQDVTPVHAAANKTKRRRSSGQIASDKAKAMATARKRNERKRLVFKSHVADLRHRVKLRE